MMMNYDIFHASMMFLHRIYLQLEDLIRFQSFRFISRIIQPILLNDIQQFLVINLCYLDQIISLSISLSEMLT